MPRARSTGWRNRANIRPGLVGENICVVMEVKCGLMMTILGVWVEANPSRDAR